MPRRYHRKAEQTSSPSVPVAQFAQTLRCRALLENGNECPSTKQKPEHKFCRPHYQEYKNLYRNYKSLEEEFYAAGLDDPEGCAEKVARGRQALTLRDQVNKRFFSVSDGNRGHARWILKLQNEVAILEERLKMGPGEARDGEGLAHEAHNEPEDGAPESEANVGQYVYRSLLSPDVPMSDLAHLPDDSPVKVLKETIAQFGNEMRQRLYRMVPSLDDSSSVIRDGEGGETRTPNVGDKVMRFVLREFILWKADADVLALASKTDSIDKFLRHVSTENTLEYIKFFETFGREDTLHFLRDALCDAVCDPIPLSDSAAVTILGEPISTDEETRRMTVKAWDTLYKYFPDYLNGTTVEFFCFRFEDVILIKRLIALKRYPDWQGGACEEQPLSAWLGFISVTQGFQDPLVPLVEKDGLITATENRCYLVGRMSKHDPMTAMFVEDLLDRVGHYIVVVYETGRDIFESPKVTRQTDLIDDNLWINRSRSADTKKRLDQTPWSVKWSLKEIRNDIRFVRSYRERNMAKDYVEVLIIDRQPGRLFSLDRLVNDVLMMLSSDPREDEIMRSAIHKSIPEDEQAKWIASCSWEGVSIEDGDIGNAHYEGARIRAWDVQQKHPDLIRSSLTIKPPRRDRRLICKILNQMKASGVISQLKEYHKPYTRPTIIYGADGLEDLYFHYAFGPVDEDALTGGPLGASPTPSSLSRFAHAFKAAHPDAVFAKGRINVHYCAWPVPAVSAPGLITFCTAEGYLYRWNAHPFDFPLSQRTWQFHVDHEINGRFSFAQCVGTTLIVAATSLGEAAKNLTVLAEATKQKGWKLTVPHQSRWTRDIDSLALSTLWAGISPALQD